MKGDQLTVGKSYNISMKKVSNPTIITVALVSKAKREPTEPHEEVVVGEGKVMQIGTCLTHEI